jgi:hypothetical protein
MDSRSEFFVMLQASLATRSVSVSGSITATSAGTSPLRHLRRRGTAEVDMFAAASLLSIRNGGFSTFDSLRPPLSPIGLLLGWLGGLKNARYRDSDYVFLFVVDGFNNSFRTDVYPPKLRDDRS